VSGFTAPLVLITVGGDQHPFDRLMGWVESWMAEKGDRVRCVVQHGHARPPAGAECYDFIDHGTLLDLMNEARAVVSSGGPTTLSEASRLGHRPVAVPRMSALGEHVDDHQRVFTKHLHETGAVVRVEDEASFRAALEAAMDAPRIVNRGDDSALRLTVDRVGAMIDLTAQRGREARQVTRPRAFAKNLVRRSA
jgi:UDP-N-acetylglucosamine transferase subunit ALG13